MFSALKEEYGVRMIQVDKELLDQVVRGEITLFLSGDWGQSEVRETNWKAVSGAPTRNTGGLNEDACGESGKK